MIVRKYTDAERDEIMDRHRTQRWLDKMRASIDEKHAERITDRADRMQELEEQDRIWRERPQEDW